MTEQGAPRPGPDQTGATFQQLFEDAPDAMVVVDTDGLIRLVNKQAESLFLYSRQEMIGGSVERIIPDHLRLERPSRQTTYLANPSTRSMSPGSEPYGRAKDGSEFPVSISLSWSETDHGTLLSAAVRNITERQRIEQEKGQVTARRLVVERDEERAMMEAQLQQAQRLETVGQLAGGVAHDFNNLLAGIMNYAGLVLASLQQEMKLRGLSDDEAFMTLANDVCEITKVAKRAALLTHQLLTFSRRTVVRPEVLDLNQVVAGMDTLLRTTIGESVGLRTLYAEKLPLIKADRGQIDQVFMNLAVNARDAMPGGGELEIETSQFQADDQYARMHAIAPGEYAQLRVSDTGVGMSREVAARVFEPFFTTKGEGSGLGLATVYGIVTQAGGNITIESVPGVGTSIRVNIPMTNEPIWTNHEVDPDVELAGAGETVLLVEDEQIVREPTRRLLAMHGYKMLAAANADAALAILAEHPDRIDLLLTDVVMPGRSGKELSIELLKQRPKTKVLFMSGYSDEVIVHQGVLEAGVNLIDKPFSSDDLLRKVRNVLDGSL